MKVEISHLDTEKINPASAHIDEVSTLEKVRIINAEDKLVPQAIEKELPRIAELIEHVVAGMKKGGRLFYAGAGTSGRLGVLDASECPPTYGVSYELVQGIIAGGQSALIKAKEGSEDDPDMGREDLKEKGLTENDTVVGIAASGRTPYVIGALRYANEVGAYTGALSCCRNAEISKEAKTSIEVICGPEVVSGSTRMKAGTAQKLVLNMISTVSMIEMGKVYKNYMVDVQPTNEKLVARAHRLIMQACNCSEEESSRLYAESKGSVKDAIVMYEKHLSLEEAQSLLKKADGNIRMALRLQ